MDPGGVEVLQCSLGEFAEVLRSENHTLKRALTDPRWFSGIGNAYSDEILWAAKLSPTTLTQKMKDEDVARLFEATRATLREWVERLRAETGEKFPEKVQNLLLFGEAGKGGKTGFRGILAYLKRMLEESTSEGYRDFLMDYMSATECPACHGQRLRPEMVGQKNSEDDHVMQHEADT